MLERVDLDWQAGFFARAIVTEVGEFVAIEQQGRILSFCPFVPECFKDPKMDAKSALLDELEAQIQAYFQGRLHQFDLPMGSAVDGLTFEVLKTIEKIGYGQRVTYGQIAASLLKPKAYRAVGSACGKNLLCVLIPCHRVLGARGLGGYALGVEIKQKLLNLEAFSRACKGL